MKSIIYYFSGTGNSYYIAKRLSEILSCGLKHISEIPLTAEQYDRIGIVCPVYATHVPSVILPYISNLKLSSPTHIFSVFSYAGSYGYAAQDIYDQLKDHAPLMYQNFKIRMPGSSILEYSAFPKNIQKVLLNRAEKQIEKVGHAIRSQTKTKMIQANFLARHFTQNAHKMIDNYAEKGTLFYTNDHCIKCKKCVKVCPTNNIAWAEDHPVWKNRCQQCMACIQWCPYNAIEHPELKHKNRKRYHNPNVTEDMLIVTQRSIWDYD